MPVISILLLPSVREIHKSGYLCLLDSCCECPKDCSEQKIHQKDSETEPKISFE